MEHDEARVTREVPGQHEGELVRGAKVDEPVPTESGRGIRVSRHAPRGGGQDVEQRRCGQAATPISMA